MINPPGIAMAVIEDAMAADTAVQITNEDKDHAEKDTVGTKV